ncbi:MAG: hypothetical protein EBV06_13425, partial [Planctomycetia bacterium]|nr:hypothetical protein [Planctomycetia bacterium]
MSRQPLLYTGSVGPTNARVNLTGYTLEAKVFTPVFANPSGEMADGAYTVGAIAATFAVGAVNLSQGQVAISLTETQTAALSPAVGYRWYFRAQDATGYTLTWLSGSFTA